MASDSTLLARTRPAATQRLGLAAPWEVKFNCIACDQLCVWRRLHRDAPGHGDGRRGPSTPRDDEANEGTAEQTERCEIKFLVDLTRRGTRVSPLRESSETKSTTAALERRGYTSRSRIGSRSTKNIDEATAAAT